MAGILTVQTIQGPTSGANANKVIIPAGQTLSVADGVQVSDLPAGSTLQMQRTQSTNSSSITTLSTSSVDSGIAVSITALKTGSKFRVFFVAPMSHANLDQMRVNLWRDDTGLIGSDFSFGYQSDSQNQYQPTVIDYLDGNTATAGTTYQYKVYFKSTGGGQVQLIHNNSGYYFTVEEIAQ
jgi:hypothetical protein